MMKKKLHPVHPGEVLLEEFLKPMEISQNGLAKFFGTSAEFWLGLQAQYDLDVTAEALGDRLDREVKTRADAG